MPSFTRRPVNANIKEELADKPCECKRHTPWLVQKYIFEILENHMLTNSPTELGFAFNQRYTKDPNTSDISIELAHDFKAAAPQKRPGIFVTRGEAAYKHPTMKQSLAVDAQEGVISRASFTTLAINVTVIAPELGFAEEFANYVFYPFLHFCPDLTKEYGFHSIRVSRYGSPEHYAQDAPESFSIALTLDVEFYSTWAIRVDALKLKQVVMSLKE